MRRHVDTSVAPDLHGNHGIPVARAELDAGIVGEALWISKRHHVPLVRVLSLPWSIPIFSLLDPSYSMARRYPPKHVETVIIGCLPLESSAITR